MHLTRAKTSKKLPIPRKGTKYVARALNNVHNSLPIIIALRDMLGLAKTAKEVNEEINRGYIKLNGKIIRDKRESIKLFNIFEADKKYKLSMLPTGRFILDETKDDFRLCKVIKKTMVKDGKMQLTMHDGTNIIDNAKIAIGDTVEIGLDGKLRKILGLKKGANLTVISGKNTGKKGKVDEVLEGKVKVILEDKVAEIMKSHLMVI